MTFELTNEQRKYFGLDPIEKHWERVPFTGDTYRPESILYYEDDTIKRHIVSTDDNYHECQFDELTKGRTVLLPKTARGKEKKLTPSVLEQRKPYGVYLDVSSHGGLLIGNYSSETTFYSSRWELRNFNDQIPIQKWVQQFISQSEPTHLEKISAFKKAKRKRVQFKSGDYFRFKLNRTEFGFGRILLDINSIRKKKLISENHGLNLLMGPPVIVQIFAFASREKDVELSVLDASRKMPSDVMMDNLLLYGEYEIIGHRDIPEHEFEFPISYGRTIDQRKVVFLQWGLIHKELPIGKFDKYIKGENLKVPEDSHSRSMHNPYGYYSIGFSPRFNSADIFDTIANNGTHDFDGCNHYRADFDLRNPKNEHIRSEILAAFGLNPTKSYMENCALTGTTKTIELLNQLEGKKRLPTNKL